MSTRHKPRDDFGDEEHGTAKRDYPPGFVEGRVDQATARIPREDLDRLLRRESGTRPKVSIATDAAPSEQEEQSPALESGTHLRPGAKPREERPLTKPTPLAVMPVPEATTPRTEATHDDVTAEATHDDVAAELAPSVPPPSLERRAVVWTLAAVVGLAGLVSAWAWIASHTHR